MISASVALALAGALGAIAAPTTSQIHTVTMVKNPNFVPNGPAHMMKTYQKYGAPVPPHVRAAAMRQASKLRRRQKGGDGSVTATPDPDQSEWLAPVEIGGKTFNLDFDTGSADLWVFGGSSGSHQTYNCASPTDGGKTLDGASWSISYGDGSSASGDVATTTVTIGGLAVKNQAVECATTASSEFESGKPDGLVGLAFSSINTVTPQQQRTWIDNAIEQSGKSSGWQFTADLRWKGTSTYTFGTCESNGDGKVNWFGIDDSQGFWQWTSSGNKLKSRQHRDHHHGGSGGGSGSGSTTLVSTGGIADTGTTLLYTSDENFLESYYGSFGGSNDEQAGGYTFDCSAKVPDVTVEIEGSSYKIPGGVVNFAPVEAGSSTCFGGIQSSAGIGIDIYGDIFLKGVVACFDPEGKKLGFQQKTYN